MTLASVLPNEDQRQILAAIGRVLSRHAGEWSAQRSGDVLEDLRRARKGLAAMVGRGGATDSPSRARARSVWGWGYEGDGVVTRFPHELFGRDKPPKIKVHSFPVKERYGLIWVWPGDPELDEDTPLPISAAILLANDVDADNDTLTITAVGTANTTGSVQLNAGQVVYDPSGQFDSLGLHGPAFAFRGAGDRRSVASLGEERRHARPEQALAGIRGRLELDEVEESRVAQVVVRE